MAPARAPSPACRQFHSALWARKHSSGGAPGPAVGQEPRGSWHVAPGSTSGPAPGGVSDGTALAALARTSARWSELGPAGSAAVALTHSAAHNRSWAGKIAIYQPN